MSAKGEISQKIFQVQSLCEEIKELLEEHGAPDFDNIRREIDIAETEWERGSYEDSVSTLENTKDMIHNQMNSVGDITAREEIVSWIEDMPTSAFINFA